ncbi:unnamed protein product [Calicophoron daubneyi]|uniref:Uncharacterized protein n=1 Tax=Calicophoron daubneyi TaxID=300641 RepID=A0AAV2TGG1_CALDB
MKVSHLLALTVLVTVTLFTSSHSDWTDIDKSVILGRPKRWALSEIHRCGPVKGYSCMKTSDCYKRYGRRDMVCFEVYPCLSSCIFIAQLLDYKKLMEQVKTLMLEGKPVNTHPDPVGYVRSWSNEPDEEVGSIRSR